MENNLPTPPSLADLQKAEADANQNRQKIRTGLRAGTGNGKFNGRYA